MNSRYVNSVLFVPAIGCQSRHRYTAVRIRFQQMSSSAAHRLRWGL